jgi:hypothetical protein
MFVIARLQNTAYNIHTMKTPRHFVKEVEEEIGEEVH